MFDEAYWKAFRKALIIIIGILLGLVGIFGILVLTVRHPWIGFPICVIITAGFLAIDLRKDY
jgi:hypothetical protein